METNKIQELIVRYHKPLISAIAVFSLSAIGYETLISTDDSNDSQSQIEEELIIPVEIVDVSNGIPLANAQIKASILGVPASGTTDSNGYWEFKTTKKGTIDFTVVKEGYEEKVQKISTESATSGNQKIALKKKESN